MFFFLRFFKFAIFFPENVLVCIASRGIYFLNVIFGMHLQNKTVEVSPSLSRCLSRCGSEAALILLAQTSLALLSPDLSPRDDRDLRSSLLEHVVSDDSSGIMFPLSKLKFYVMYNFKVK